MKHKKGKETEQIIMENQQTYKGRQNQSQNCDITDKEFKMIELKKSNKLQEDSERQYNDFGIKLIEEILYQRY